VTKAGRSIVVHGDCEVVLRAIASCSVDAVVTDPPAGIGFMGKAWDGDRGGRAQWVAWLASAMRECLRVLRPGGHALVWALPRTSHWTATAVEDAGFEIRDVHHHIFGTGFPKNLDVAKAGAKRWKGHGTALKPAVEHWILGRKPLEGTVAANVTRHGTGTLNIEACRIGVSGGGGGGGGAFGAAWAEGSGLSKEYTRGPDVGRWPAHLSLDEEAAVLLDEQAGERQSGSLKAGKPRGQNSVFGKAPKSAATDVDIPASVGGASRFFYIAKPPRSEKDAGLEELPAVDGGEATGRAEGSAGTRSPRAGAGRTGGGRNTHPTVKAVALMRWLVRLITPPGGLVLDPFAGSGTTGVACAEESMRFLGIEQDAKNHEIARLRLRRAYGSVATELPSQTALAAVLTAQPRAS
jgi:hypothetical protein